MALDPINTANPTARGFGPWNNGGQQSAFANRTSGTFPGQTPPGVKQTLASGAGLPGVGGNPNPATAAPQDLVNPGAPTPQTNPAIPAGPGSQPQGAFTSNPLLNQLQNPNGQDQQDPMSGVPMVGQGPGAAAQPGGALNNTRGAFASAGPRAPSGFGGASSGFGRAGLGAGAGGRR